VLEKTKMVLPARSKSEALSVLSPETCLSLKKSCALVLPTPNIELESVRTLAECLKLMKHVYFLLLVTFLFFCGSSLSMLLLNLSKKLPQKLLMCTDIFLAFNITNLLLLLLRNKVKSEA